MHSKKQPISSLKKDDEVDDIFVVKSKSEVGVYKNGYSFSIRLADASGFITVKFWGNDDRDEVERIHGQVAEGSAAVIKGRVVEWQNKLEISTNFPPIVLLESDYPPGAFLRSSTRPADQLLNKLLVYARNIENQFLRDTVLYFYRDDRFITNFLQQPASVSTFRNYIGGLVEHTLCVVELCELLAKQHDLDSDLLISAALLHGIGKLQALKFKLDIVQTKNGSLLGHTHMGAAMLQEAMNAVGMPQKLQSKLLHMILAQKGNYGDVKPAFPEALALHTATWADANLQGMQDIIEQSSSDEEFVYHKKFGNLFLK